MDYLDLLAMLLKRKGTMKYKYLAKRILEQRDSYNTIVEEKNKRQCYELLLLLFDSETTENLKKIDAIVHLVSKRIEDDSEWKWDSNREFINSNNYIERICFAPEGFTGYREGEFTFLQQYCDGLDVIHSLLMEKDNIMAGNYQLKDENDRDLVELLIKYLGYSEESVLSNNKVK